MQGCLQNGLMVMMPSGVHQQTLAPPEARMEQDQLESLGC